MMKMPFIYVLLLSFSLSLSLSISSWAIEIEDIVWEARGTEDVILQQASSPLLQEEAQELKEKIMSRLAEDGEKNGIKVVKSRSLPPPHNRRVIVSQEIFQKYGIDKIDTDDNGRKFYERYHFQHLAHTTSINNILKILSAQTIKPRDQVGDNSIDYSGSICNTGVVYTMMFPEWAIVPNARSRDIPNGVALALPLQLLERKDWHISPSWGFGYFTEGSAQGRQAKKVFEEKDKAVKEWLAYEAHTPETAKDDAFGLRLLMVKLVNEVIFQNEINLKKPDGEGEGLGLDVGLNLKLVFSDEDLREDFITAVNESEDLSSKWEVGEKSETTSTVPTLTLNRK